MAAYNWEHVFTYEYRKEPLDFPYSDDLAIHVVFLCGKEVPKRYAFRYIPAANRKLCRECKKVRDKPMD